MAGSETSKTSSDGGEVQGEGDGRSAKSYQDAQHAFAKDQAKVEQGAKAAENAIEGQQGAELERARQQAAKGEPKTH